ncbi:Fic/DOC family protein [Paenibacillus allorhizosphaerae]|uniref:protein adenylyltransferase n=1 Tax=Paenibacillus allorhizosphaerae TaxID=2849866 RepID=A0ABN7TNL2_9BACL|nr:Fic family protein [Paenibacillus allorhizosphaerae]CAG7643582.1 Protein adenylyltransferase VbhT [Paenibacillus allorhizosphaerae]
MAAEFRDPYLFEDIDVMRNKFGIRDQAQLHKAEVDHTMLRLIQLELKPIPGDFDAKHLQVIHKHIFQDVYDWAGEYRTVDMSKYYDNLGRNMTYWHHQDIGDALGQVSDRLKQEGYLKDAPNSEAFVQRASRYMAAINQVHPFREGNGRSQREFIRTLALNAGYRLDWSRVPERQLTNVRAKSLIDHGEDLAPVMKQCISNSKPDPQLARSLPTPGKTMER